MIFVAAAFIIATSVDRLFNPRMPEQLGVGLTISVGASLINGAVALVLLKKGREHGSATLIADGKHLMTDVVTSVPSWSVWRWWQSPDADASTRSSHFSPAPTSCGPASA